MSTDERHLRVRRKDEGDKYERELQVHPAVPPNAVNIACQIWGTKNQATAGIVLTADEAGRVIVAIAKCLAAPPDHVRGGETNT